MRVKSLIVFVVTGLVLSAWVRAVDAISFTERYVESLVQVQTFPDDPILVEYDIAGVDTFKGSAKVALPGLSALSVTADTALEVSFGQTGFLGVAGEADLQKANSWTFRLTTEDFETGQVTEYGRVVFSRNQDTATVTLDIEQADPVLAGAYLNLNETFQDTVEFGISWGELQLNRTLYYTAKATMTEKTVGTGEEAETFELSDVQIAGGVDSIPPKVSITSPRANTRTEIPVVQVVVGATDNVGVQEVYVRLNEDGDELLAEPSTTIPNAWIAEVELLPGTNILYAAATDVSGNRSGEISRKVFLVVKSPIELAVDPEEGGSITGAVNGQLLELGRTYTVTAKPAANYIFKNWSGSLDSTKASLTFVMEEDMSLTASFLENPYPTLKGSYYGLFQPGDVRLIPSPTNSGLYVVTLTEKGVLSGKVMMGQKTYSFSGIKLTPDDCGCSVSASFSIKRGSLLPPLQISINAPVGLESPMEGMVWTDAWESTLEAYRLTAQPELAGKYTFGLPAGEMRSWDSEDARELPGGSGAGALTIDAKGTVKLTGVLGDGTAITHSSGLVPIGDGQSAWPIYVPLQQGKGLLIGWGELTVYEDFPLNPMIESLGLWIKSPVSSNRDKYYPAGFAVETVLMGARYQSPKPGLPLFNWSENNLVLAGGNLAVPIEHAVEWTGGKLVLRDNPEKIKITVTSTTGLVSGSFMHPDLKKSVSFKGALIQWPNSDYVVHGWFLGAHQSGALNISEE